MSKTTYAQRLLDPRWQRKRASVLERDDFTCVLCGATDKTVHVHHTIYKNYEAPWESDISDLITLCCDCHENQKPTNEEYLNPAILNIRRHFVSPMAKLLVLRLFERTPTETYFILSALARLGKDAESILDNAVTELNKKNQLERTSELINQ